MLFSRTQTQKQCYWIFVMIWNAWTRQCTAHEVVTSTWFSLRFVHWTFQLDGNLYINRERVIETMHKLHINAHYLTFCCVTNQNQISNWNLIINRPLTFMIWTWINLKDAFVAHELQAKYRSIFVQLIHFIWMTDIFNFTTDNQHHRCVQNMSKLIKDIKKNNLWNCPKI